MNSPGERSSPFRDASSATDSWFFSSSGRTPISPFSNPKHLHHRTLSTSVRITIPPGGGTPVTPPRASYRLVADYSPATRRARKRVQRTRYCAREWIEDRLRKGVGWRRAAVWLCLAGELLIVVAHVLTGGVGARRWRFGPGKMVEGMVAQDTLRLGEGILDAQTVLLQPKGEDKTRPG